ncbi:MAG: MarR family transcriptional regulator [Alphaproteobacteria bacterium]|nr:MarR family transcriptional regulator [Alphaproteobacteria bacterium]
MRRTNEGEALTSLMLETFRLNGALLASGNQLTKPFGLTSARWQVLGPIAEEILTVAQIARRMGLARQGVQRIVNDLESLGLIVLKPNLDHKRAPLVALTETGKEVMAEVDKVQAVWVNKLADGLSERQIKQALKVIETVREGIE